MYIAYKFLERLEQMVTDSRINRQKFYIQYLFQKSILLLIRSELFQGCELDCVNSYPEYGIKKLLRKFVDHHNLNLSYDPYLIVLSGGIMLKR
jgi:hypothetical protein